MACRLLVKNKANSYATGEVLGVFAGDHTFGKFESKLAFLEAGLTDWPREFVIVNVVDAEPSAYAYLLDTDDDGKALYRLVEQGSESPFYNQLLESAEVTVTSAILDALTISRGV